MNAEAIGGLACAGFFDQLQAAERRLLIMEYDGTIAPFRADRRNATPYPHVRELLRAIMVDCNTRLIIVTGRPAREVPPLLDLWPVPEIWGTYGLERIDSRGTYTEERIGDGILEILSLAEQSLDEAGIAEFVEVKLAAVAVHWRSLSRNKESAVCDTAHRVLQGYTRPLELELAEFDGGVELRLCSANKGKAVKEILATMDAGTPLAYLGADASDEDAFLILNRHGMTARVSERQRTTAAQLCLTPPEEPAAFLSHWANVCGGGRSASGEVHAVR